MTPVSFHMTLSPCTSQSFSFRIYIMIRNGDNDLLFTWDVHSEIVASGRPGRRGCSKEDWTFGKTRQLSPFPLAGDSPDNILMEILQVDSSQHSSNLQAFENLR